MLNDYTPTVCSTMLLKLLVFADIYNFCFTTSIIIRTFSNDLLNERLLSSQKPVVFDWTKEKKILMEPIEYVQKLGFKHHRLTAPAFNHWLQIPQDKLNDIQEIMRDWITWTILLDDVQDDSAFRYGVPAVHHVFGVGLSINGISMVLLQMQRKITKLGHPLGLEILNKRTEETVHGQGIDVYWREKYVMPSEEVHIEMTKIKSGAAFILPVELMQLFSSNKKDYTGLAMKIGIYYEILDDYYNLFAPKALQTLGDVKLDNNSTCSDIPEGKFHASQTPAGGKQDNYMTCSDITEGKLSLAVIHASQFPDVATEIADILKQRTSDPKLQNRFIALLRKHCSDEYVRANLRSMAAEIHKEIDELGGNPKLTAFMDDLDFQKHELGQEQEIYS